MSNKTRITELRRDRGWTQEKLAEESNLSVRTIQRLESGEDASLETLRLVAEALDVKMDELFSEIVSSSREDEIKKFATEQEQQIKRRRAAGDLFSLAKTGFFILMIFLAIGISLVPEDFQNMLGLIWFAVFLIGFKMFRYLKNTWWSDKLDEKYPLTKSLIVKDNESQREKFFWWNNSSALRYLLFSGA